MRNKSHMRNMHNMCPNDVSRVFGVRFSAAAVLQYGRIVDVDLKVPPRPPGYAFVEVSDTLIQGSSVCSGCRCV